MDGWGGGTGGSAQKLTTVHLLDGAKCICAAHVCKVHFYAASEAPYYGRITSVMNMILSHFRSFSIRIWIITHKSIKCPWGMLLRESISYGLTLSC